MDQWIICSNVDSKITSSYLNAVSGTKASHGTNIPSEMDISIEMVNRLKVDPRSSFH